jgi:hypothetical protein
MQKLVTIYLDNAAYGKPKVDGCYGERHGDVEEHLQNYLAEGWRIEKLFGFGGADSPAAQGWVVVTLEKDES